MAFKRVFVLVLDGCGAGQAPDAGAFGDDLNHPGDTLVHVAKACGGLRIGNLRKLGLGNLLPMEGGAPVENPGGFYARLLEASQGGKDTVTGHWEMMGIVVPERFPTYPDGFDKEIIEKFERATGRKALGNRAASGTVIIDELGEEHMRTGSPIVYTSADSVFQIACHEQVIPIEELYDICLKSREFLNGEHAVQRVIARPFEGAGLGSFRRTERRKDFPLAPPENVLDLLTAAGVFTAGVGVIPEVFGGRGFAYSERTQTNEEHYLETLKLMAHHDRGFFFVNFEDFDMLYGHRLDPAGFGKALETFDGYLGEILEHLGPDDLLMLTADHGNDPTIPSTDHTREYAPLLMTSPAWSAGGPLGDRPTFADVGATVLEAFGVQSNLPGTPLQTLPATR
ncbi:MAG: phosphopentomutase [Candidatus Eremiobacteraeota bacterium]|nr:phosphopentomutase [Candidatus Eremiobacteraeota bacterium]